MSDNASKITVWGRRNSMNVQKVMWALGELGRDYQRHDMAGSFGIDAQYTTKNPNAVVPTIELPLYENYVRLGGTIDLYSHPVDDAHIFVQDLHHEQMQRTNANPFNSGSKEHYEYMTSILGK